jgi:hypothetical protein
MSSSPEQRDAADAGKPAPVGVEDPAAKGKSE